MAKSDSTPGRRPPKTQKPTCTVKQIKVGSIVDREHLVPWVRLQGQWLKKAGFDIHTPVQIHVMDRCLIFKVGE